VIPQKDPACPHCRDKFLKARKASLFKNKLFLTCIFSLLLVTLSLFLPPLRNWAAAFQQYLKMVWWAILLGLFLGGLLEHYIPREYISKVLAQRSPRTILNAVFLGFLMSACSHGILALAIQLHKKGASNPAVVAFLLASPWANISITIMLLAFFGPKGLFIIFAAIIIAVNTGFIFALLEKKGLIEKNTNTLEVPGDFSIPGDIKKRLSGYRFSASAVLKDLKGILQGAWALSGMVLWWIILGMLIASFATAYVPVHFFHKFMGPTILGMLVTLVMATLIEVCSEGSSPLAFGIYQTTGALGNSFVFLMAGVVTDYTEIGLLWANVGRRVALWMPAVTVPQVILLGYLANLLFR